MGRRKIEIDLRDAIQNEGLQPYYQPLVDLSSGRITGLEALVRWPHPERGMISPGEFIPVAEETGLINPLGSLMLHRACMDAAQWPDDVRVAVNLSPLQFRTGNLLALVTDALRQSGLPARRLELAARRAGEDAERDAAKKVRLVATLRDDCGGRVMSDAELRGLDGFDGRGLALANALELGLAIVPEVTEFIEFLHHPGGDGGPLAQYAWRVLGQLGPQLGEGRIRRVEPACPAADDGVVRAVDHEAKGLHGGQGPAEAVELGR